MDLEKLRAPLKAEEIDFRIQSISEKGWAIILAYKDARVDINRLDSVCGPLNWMRQHTRDNHNCIVSIWDESKSEWVSKEDTGTESMTEKEKGLASDSFKRACFNWGIGIELYDYPLVMVKLNPNEFTVDGRRGKQTYNLKLRDWVWENEFDSSGNITKLTAKDQNGKTRFTWSSGDNKSAPSKAQEPKGKIVDDAKLTGIKGALSNGTIKLDRGAIDKILQKGGFNKLNDAQWDELKAVQ